MNTRLANALFALTLFGAGLLIACTETLAQAAGSSPEIRQDAAPNESVINIPSPGSDNGKRYF